MSDETKGMIKVLKNVLRLLKIQLIIRDNAKNETVIKFYEGVIEGYYDCIVEIRSMVGKPLGDLLRAL